MQILIIRLSSIGDVVHALPAVGALRDRYPGCRISWLVEDQAADLLRGYQGIDRVIAVRKWRLLGDIRSLRFGQALSVAQELLHELRQDHYDLVIDFQGLLKSGVLACLARGKRRLGYANAREGSHLFYSERAPAPAFHDHAIARHMALLQVLGISDVPVSFAFYFGPDITARVDAICYQEAIDSGRPAVCFNPATTWPTKLWEQDKAARLCALLHEQCGAQVLLVGAAGDQARLEQIRSLAGPGARNLAGRLSLRELACQVSRSDLMISMDSGPMHIACAVGTPVVALFGPTAPWRTGPFGSGHSVVRTALACSPCFQRGHCPEEHHRCMRDITVEEVFAVCCNYIKT